MATLMAGGLGAGAHHLANLSGHIGEPILLGFFVFLQGIFNLTMHAHKIKIIAPQSSYYIDPYWYMKRYSCIQNYFGFCLQLQYQHF
jgi:hypothetical protein